MKKIYICSFLCLFLTSCSKVPAGYIGVKVYLLGQKKGVDNEVLDVGRYWIGFNEKLYLYPTYQINYTFTRDPKEGSKDNEEFTFQTQEGLTCSMDLGVSVSLDKRKIPDIFQKYRKGIDEIRGIVIRNALRDALAKISSMLPIESVYGSGKGKMIEDVQRYTKNSLDTMGIMIEKISIIGEIRLPNEIVNALNAKVSATQKAQQRENELREAEAEAKKKIATAMGEAEANIAIAKGEAESNRIKQLSISERVIEWQRVQNEKKAIEKWNGKLPTVTSQSIPFINIKNQ